MADKVYLPKQHVKRGEAGYKGDNIVVVDREKFYGKAVEENAEQVVGPRGRKVKAETEGSDAGGDSNE